LVEKKPVFSGLAIYGLNSIQYFCEFGGFWLLATTFWQVSIDLANQVTSDTQKTCLKWLSTIIKTVVWILLVYISLNLFTGSTWPYYSTTL
jgi:hypothetical protein